MPGKLGSSALWLFRYRPPSQDDLRQFLLSDHEHFDSFMHKRNHPSSPSASSESSQGQKINTTNSF